MKQELSLQIESLIRRDCSLGNIGYYLAKNLRYKIHNFVLKPWLESDFELINNQFKEIINLKNEPVENSLIVCDPLYDFRSLKAKHKYAYLYYDQRTLDRKHIENINNNLDCVIAMSEFSKKRFEGFGIKRVEMIPLGVDKLTFYQNNTGNMHAFTFLNYGEQGERKGTDILIKAFDSAFINAENMRLLILDTESKLKKSKMQNSHIEIRQGKVNIETLRNIINDCDCYVAPTREDSFGMPGLESMACGLPVVATRNTGYETYVTALNGYLIDNNKSNHKVFEFEPEIRKVRSAMIKAMIDYKDFPEFWESKQWNAINTANEFSWENTCDKLIKLLQRKHAI